MTKLLLCCLGVMGVSYKKSKGEEIRRSYEEEMYDRHHYTHNTLS